LAINVIESYIKQMPNLLQLVGTSTNPLVGIELIRKHKADVVFLDIQMDEMNGIDVMKLVDSDTKVVFCTAYSEFAVDSYELDAVDYLVKPIPFNRFVKAVHRIMDVLSPEAPVNNDAIPCDYIFVKTEQKGKLLKIDFDDIAYVEAMGNYIGFHRGSQKTMAHLTMKDIEERLPQNQFMRVHKSYIVSLKHIAAVENNDLLLKNRQERIPISTNYKDAFMQLMRDNLLM
jgi:two-component system LytT family response regulator